MATKDDSLPVTGHRTLGVYQRPSTGEKHVLFYPTTTASTASSEERRSWPQESTSTSQQNVSFYLFFMGLGELF